MKTRKFLTNLKSLLPALFLNLIILILWPVYATNDVWVDNGDGTVSDVATGLIWERDRSNATYATAFTYCQNLSLAGETDWRLPNVKELTSLIDYRSDFPAIDTRAFISTNNNASFWSSTEFAGDSSEAFAISIIDGRVEARNKLVLRRVRCVR